MPDIVTLRQQIRIRAREDAAAGWLLGNLDRTMNWLYLQNAPEEEWEDLLNCYVEAYDEALGHDVV